MVISKFPLEALEYSSDFSIMSKVVLVTFTGSIPDFSFILLISEFCIFKLNNDSISLILLNALSMIPSSNLSYKVKFTIVPIKKLDLLIGSFFMEHPFKVKVKTIHRKIQICLKFSILPS